MNERIITLGPLDFGHPKKSHLFLVGLFLVHTLLVGLVEVELYRPSS